jgi:hypothetical protein
LVGKDRKQRNAKTTQEKMVQNDIEAKEQGKKDRLQQFN